MEFKEQDYHPEELENTQEQSVEPTKGEPNDLPEGGDAENNRNLPPYEEEKGNREGRVSWSFLTSLVCIVAAIAMLITFAVTNAANRFYYSTILTEQQEIIDAYKEAGKTPSGSTSEFDELELMALLFQQFSYYANDFDEEELLTAVMKAYASATGDRYAEYYTEEEYEAILSDREGTAIGIGAHVLQTTVSVDGAEYKAFQITSIYKNAPADGSGLQVGDYIYGIKTANGFQTVDALGGYAKARGVFAGEKGTSVEFLVFRETNGEYASIAFNLVRNDYEAQSVTYRLAEGVSNTGIVHISSFDLTTPSQLKTAVGELQKQGVEHFVFDVRYNPGGDLQSIKACLTYFLQKGDLILSSIDRKGKVAKSYYAEEMSFTGEYAACGVAESEIGMFADLDMVVLCNGGTASAAEVFTATLRDYGLAEVVGETTFGKGVMQSYLPMSAFGNYSGYVKLTTYAYVTQCGVTYHDLGIKPTVGEEIPLSEEALTYNFYVLPQSIDNQLQAALAQFKS